MRQANWTNDHLDDFGGAGTWHKNGTWLAISIGGGRYHVRAITLTTLTQDVTVSAADLSKGIDATGHAVVPGILFDTARADVKDESKPALDEVAKLLSANPKLNALRRRPHGQCGYGGVEYGTLKASLSGGCFRSASEVSRCPGAIGLVWRRAVCPGGVQ